MDPYDGYSSLPDEIRRNIDLEKVIAKGKEAPFGWTLVPDQYGDPIAYFKSDAHARFFIEALTSGRVPASDG